MYGAIRKPEDSRDYIFKGVSDINWKKGYDIRNELGHDIVINDQMKSSSCVGQAWTYLVEIYDELDIGAMKAVSPKAIYSQIFVPDGGAYIYDGGRIVTKWGSVTEKIVPSKTPAGYCTEVDMRDLSWKKPNIDELARLLLGKELQRIKVPTMNSFAEAIERNKGVVGGVEGQNGKGWHTERPQPPDSVEWGHAIAFLAYGEDEHGKYIATPNSWGRKTWSEEWKPGDAPGKGWQKLYENYLPYMFDAWTYTDIPNNMDNEFVKIIKDKNSKSTGFYLPCTSEEALKTMCLLYNKTLHKKDGEVDWEKLVEGEFTLNK